MCNCDNPLEFYNKYHQNFWNKLIHIIFIPFIILSIRILIDKFYIGIISKNSTIKPLRLSLAYPIMTFYIFYYFTYGFFPGLIMNIYFACIEMMYSYIHDNIPRKYLLAFCMFIFGWTMQFIGHGIEGSRPALFDNISQAFTAAPLFSIQAFLPAF